MIIEPIQLHMDKKEQIFDLLQQLTTAFSFDDERFTKIINSLYNNHYIFLYIDDEKVCGMITIIIEQKLIHNGASVAHIEDLVIDKEYRKQGIGKKLLEYAIDLAKKSNCYKVILDCDKDLISFYKKNEFKEKGIQMSLYF
jgi:glucosamine-phosphate N-acetyltransferase